MHLFPHASLFPLTGVACIFLSRVLHFFPCACCIFPSHTLHFVPHACYTFSLAHIAFVLHACCISLPHAIHAWWIFSFTLVEFQPCAFVCVCVFDCVCVQYWNTALNSCPHEDSTLFFSHLMATHDLREEMWCNDGVLVCFVKEDVHVCTTRMRKCLEKHICVAHAFDVDGQPMRVIRTSCYDPP